MKTYQVQTWNPDGSLKDHYKVDVENDTAHVMLTALPKKPAVKKK